jgi:hypothetical protein
LEIVPTSTPRAFGEKPMREPTVGDMDHPAVQTLLVRDIPASSPFGTGFIRGTITKKTSKKPFHLRSPVFVQFREKPVDFA